MKRVLYLLIAGTILSGIAAVSASGQMAKTNAAEPVAAN